MTANAWLANGRGMNMAIWTGVGVALGAGIGAALGDLAIGVAIGVAAGAALGIGLDRQRRAGSVSDDDA